MELVALDVVLVDWRRNQDVNRPAPQVGRCCFQGFEGGGSGNFRGLRQLDLYLIFHAVDEVHAVCPRLFCLRDDVHVHHRQFQHLPMVGRNLRRTVNYRHAQLRHTCIAKSLQYDFVSYAIDISVGNTHFNQSFFHILCCF